MSEDFGTLTISSGGTASPALSSNMSAGRLKSALFALKALTVFAPRSLGEDVTVQISPVENPGATDWINASLINVGLEEQLLTEDGLQILDENGEVILAETLTAGGIATLVNVTMKDLRLLASAAVAANRVFRLMGKLQVSD